MRAVNLLTGSNTNSKYGNINKIITLQAIYKF